MPEEYDSVISEELAEISKGLHKRHRTGVSGTTSMEMMQLRNRTDELAEAFGSGNETNREKKLKDAYKASLNYEMMKRENHEEYDWEPDSVMGKERMKSAKQLRELVAAYFPEIAQQAITEFREEKKNHKYAVAAAAVTDYAMAGLDNGRTAAVSAQRQQLNAKRKIVRDSERYLDDQERAIELQQKEFDESKKKQAETERAQRFAQIKNGLNKLHSGNVAILPSSEMRKLRKTEDSMEKALKEAGGNVNDPKVVQKMKAVYLASMGYELAKRKGDASEEWHPSSEMGRERMASARDIRKFVAENHPEIAEEANREFLEKHTGKSNYAAAQAVAGYTDKTIKENKERLQKENIRERAELARKQALLDRKRIAEAKKEHDLKKTDRLDEIDKGLNAVHRGKVAGTASSEMTALRKANTDLKVSLREAEGNVNDPAVLESMYNAYKASLNYEMLKRKDDTSPDFKPSTRMGIERLDSSRRLREFVIEHCPDIAQKVARDFAFEHRGKKYGKTAESVAKSDQDSIDLHLLKQQSDLKNADVELNIRGIEVERRNADIELQRHDLELQKMQEAVRGQKMLDEQQRRSQSAKIREGLYAKHKGFMTGKSSDEMKEMRQANYRMDHAINASDGDFNDPKAEAAMIAAYKASMKYELYKRQNDAGASWTPSTDMGKKRMESSRNIREYIATKRPDLAEKAGNEFLNEYKNHKYNKALSVVVNYAKPFITAAKKEKENETRLPNQADFEARRELIARQRIKIEAGIMACERVKAQISGTELTLDSKKQQEYAKQQEELDKQKTVLLHRQGELEIRPDAEVPDVQVQIVNEAPVKKEEEPELQRDKPEAVAERQDEQPHAGEVLHKPEEHGVEEIRNADNIHNLENAVIVNNEVVEAEKAGEKKEDNAPENNNESENFDNEAGEMKEEIGNPQKPAFQVQKQEGFFVGAVQQSENVPQEQELDENGFEIEYHEPQKESNELNEGELEIVRNEPKEAPVEDEQKSEDFVIENTEPEKQPMKQVLVQPVPEQEVKAGQEQSEIDEVKAEPAKEADVHNDSKPKTLEQQHYEQTLVREKQSIMNKLASFETDKENGIKPDREAYKKTVAEAMAVEKLESMYRENGRMFDKTFETQKQLYADFNSKNAHFERFTSMREPGQIIERMINDKSLSTEMEQRKYDPSLTLNGFIRQYKDKDFRDMSQIDFNEMVQDSKTVMRDDIRRSTGKVSEEEMNIKLARFATFNSISPTDPKTGRLKGNGTINRLRSMKIDLDDVLGEDGLSDSRNNPEFKSLLNKYGTEKLTEMALDGDGQKLSAELIQAGVRHKSDEKTYAKQRESATELQRQPNPEMGMKKK